ncbi:MAG: MBL fold metallo-hydrolase [Candidatus Competibacterales bacterium]
MDHTQHPSQIAPRHAEGNADADALDRRRFLTLAGATAAGALVAGQSRPAVAQSPAWQQPGNNRHVLDLQQQGGEASAEGAVTMDFFGHCAFRITSPGGFSLMVDPWRNDPSGAWGLWFPNEFPEVVVDATLSTHTHFDHDALYRPKSTMVLDRLVGEFRFADVAITGLADKHACQAPGWYNWTNAIAEFGQQACPPDNPGHMDMVMYVIETGGVRTLIWGDNRPNPPEAVWDRIGRVDVLTLPIDGSEHILSYEQGNAIVERLKPKVVIPTHYLCEGTTLTLSTLQTADDWVASQTNKTTLEKPRLVLHGEEIQAMDREFMYFQHQVAKA